MSNDHSQEVVSEIAAMRQDIKHMTKQIENMASVSERTIRNEESTKSAHIRLNEIEDSQKWTWRAIVGGIIAFAIDKLFM